MAIYLNFLVIVAFVRLEQKILSQFKRIFWRSASLSHVATLKKDGNEAIIPKVKMATSHVLFTFLLSAWQAVFNEGQSFTVSIAHSAAMGAATSAATNAEVTVAGGNSRRWRRAKLCPVLTVVRGELERGESTVPRRPVHRGVQALCLNTWRSF